MNKVGRKQFGHYDDELAVVELLFFKANSKPHGKSPTLQKIADKLNKDGHKTQTGLQWYPMAVGRIKRKGLKYYQTLKEQREKEPEPVPEKKTKNKPKPISPLTKIEIDKCRAALNDSDRVIFEVLLRAGLRASECCALEVQDINIFDGNSKINVRLGKGAKPRNVNIGSSLKEILSDHLNTSLFHLALIASGETPVFTNKRGRQLTYSNLYDRIIKLKKRAEITCLYPHKLRHTFGTHLHNIKKNLKHVRDQLGHASIATTQIYVKTLDKEKLEEMEDFDKSMDT